MSAEEMVQSYLNRACKLLDEANNTYAKAGMAGPSMPTQLQTIMVALMLQLAEKPIQIIKT